MPVRITEGDISKYQLGEAFDSLKVSRKLKFQGEREVLGTTKVFKSFIDTNGHLNNADYMRIVEQFLPKGKKYNQIEIVYKKEALIDEEIVCVAYNNQDYLGINLESADGHYRNAGISVCIFQIINQLCQIFNTVNIVMRWW